MRSGGSPRPGRRRVRRWRRGRGRLGPRWSDRGGWVDRAGLSSTQKHAKQKTNLRREQFIFDAWPDTAWPARLSHSSHHQLVSLTQLLMCPLQLAAELTQLLSAELWEGGGQKETASQSGIIQQRHPPTSDARHQTNDDRREAAPYTAASDEERRQTRSGVIHSGVRQRQSNRGIRRTLSTRSNHENPTESAWSIRH